MKGALAIEVRRDPYERPRGAGEAREIPVEVPIAIEISGIAYAVMMATPLDVEDFVTGFILGEGLADVGEIGPVAIHPVDGGDWGSGLVARVNLSAARTGLIVDRARRRLGDSSCGICGIESIEAALRPLPRVSAGPRIGSQAIKRALDGMAARQELGRETGGTHAAAFCDVQGTIVSLREDVGRHNALDKLFGTLAREQIDPASGFVVLTSRCSYELVEKTVRAGCPLLVTMSAPTDLAVRRAKAAGLALAVVARHDSMLWANRPTEGANEL